METALIFSQTLFYIVVSLAIIVIGVLCVAIAYNLLKITRQLEKISRNVKDTSALIASQIEEILHTLSKLPFMSFFMKNRSVDKDDDSVKKTKKPYGRT